MLVLNFFGIYKDYFPITFGLDLMCNDISKVRSSCFGYNYLYTNLYFSFFKVFQWKAGDPCGQPKQMAHTDMKPCIHHHKFDYFMVISFSKIYIYRLFIYPTKHLCILVLAFWHFICISFLQ